MKLKNKKTGEIIEFDAILPVRDVSGDSVAHLEYNSLTEFNEEWEDVSEEPKDFWHIDDFAIMCGTEGEFTTPDLGSFTKRDIKRLKEIGNYFETKEEAEKAVDQLKAWRRLKDKGFEFEWVDKDTGSIKFAFFNREGKITKEMWQDIDLLFSGGEE